MNNPERMRTGNHVAYWDEDGDVHEAVVIDVFDNPNGYGQYVNLAYNPDQVEFGANTLSDLEDDTSVLHRVNSDSPERTWTTERVLPESEE